VLVREDVNTVKGASLPACLPAIQPHLKNAGLSYLWDLSLLGKWNFAREKQNNLRL
jgi:hypothetical protein